MDKGVVDTVKDHKRKHDDDKDDDDEDPPAGTNYGKKTKRRRTKESESSKKPSSTKKPQKVIMDDVGDDVVHKLDWDNPERDRYLFDLSKPLPLQGPPGHRTAAADYFFDNDLEYLKTSNPEVTYTTSIIKIKAARYKIKVIKDIVHTHWSTIQHAYDKDASMGIKHWDERRKLWYQY
nr:hypothetical protein [Tanacetum cinerariifolium]